MVGAVIVRDDRVIAEGWHRRFGEAHAEINALRAVPDPSLLPESTMYVNLEPCSHYGKTPPCADAIIEAGVGRVVVGCLDPNPAVSGQGVAKLRAAGVEVEMAEAPRPFVDFNCCFFLNQQFRRPYILLKWAETADGMIGRSYGERLRISGPVADKYVHYLRSVYQAIMIGKNTALGDNPHLNLRNYYGAHPVRILFDIELELPLTLNVFGPEGSVLVINRHRNDTVGNVEYFIPERAEAYMNLALLAQELYARRQIGSILVEGGRYLLQQFINQGMYDEIQVVRSPDAAPDADIPAPVLLYNFKFDEISPLGGDFLFRKKVQHIYQ